MLVPAIAGTETVRIYTTETKITAVRGNTMDLEFTVSHQDVEVPRIVFIEMPE